MDQRKTPWGWSILGNQSKWPETTITTSKYFPLKTCWRQWIDTCSTYFWGTNQLETSSFISFVPPQHPAFQAKKKSTAPGVYQAKEETRSQEDRHGTFGGENTCEIGVFRKTDRKFTCFSFFGFLVPKKKLWNVRFFGFYLFTHRNFKDSHQQPGYLLYIEQEFPVLTASQKCWNATDWGGLGQSWVAFNVGKNMCGLETWQKLRKIRQWSVEIFSGWCFVCIFQFLEVNKKPRKSFLNDDNLPLVDIKIPPWTN